MKIDLGAGELCLAEDHPLRLREARGLRIRCTQGTVWITVAGFAHDIYLQAGEDYCIPDNGSVLIEGARHGRVMVNPERKGQANRLSWPDLSFFPKHRP